MDSYSLAAARVVWLFEMMEQAFHLPVRRVVSARACVPFHIRSSSLSTLRSSAHRCLWSESAAQERAALDKFVAKLKREFAGA